MAKDKKKYHLWIAECRARKGRMAKMRAKGASCREIGDVFGVTRQRVQQILASGT